MNAVTANDMRFTGTWTDGGAATDRDVAGLRDGGGTDPGEFDPRDNPSGMTANELRMGVDPGGCDDAHSESTVSGSPVSELNEADVRKIFELLGLTPPPDGSTGLSDSEVGVVRSDGPGCNGSTPDVGPSPRGDGPVGGPGGRVGSAEDSPEADGPVTTTPSGGSGEFTLGSTDIEIEGGTAEQRAKVEETFIALYENSPEFRDKIDAKADAGINVGFEEFGGNTAGMAQVGGTDMWMDSSYMNGGSWDIAEVIAHEVGHLDGMNHGPEMDAYSSRAAQSVA